MAMVIRSNDRVSTLSKAASPLQLGESAGGFLNGDVTPTWRTVFQGINFITYFMELIQFFGKNHIYCVTLRMWQNIFLQSSQNVKLVHCTSLRSGAAVISVLKFQGYKVLARHASISGQENSNYSHNRILMQ